MRHVKMGTTNSRFSVNVTKSAQSAKLVLSFTVNVSSMCHQYQKHTVVDKLHRTETMIPTDSKCAKLKQSALNIPIYITYIHHCHRKLILTQKALETGCIPTVLVTISVWLVTISVWLKLLTNRTTSYVVVGRSHWFKCSHKTGRHFFYMYILCLCIVFNALFCIKNEPWCCAMLVLTQCRTARIAD